MVRFDSLVKHFFTKICKLRTKKYYNIGPWSYLPRTVAATAAGVMAESLKRQCYKTLHH
jgi:hypothetical protein